MQYTCSNEELRLAKILHETQFMLDWRGELHNDGQ